MCACIFSLWFGAPASYSVSEIVVMTSFLQNGHVPVAGGSSFSVFHFVLYVPLASSFIITSFSRLSISVRWIWFGRRHYTCKMNLMYEIMAKREWADKREEGKLRFLWLVGRGVALVYVATYVCMVCVLRAVQSLECESERFVSSTDSFAAVREGPWSWLSRF